MPKPIHTPAGLTWERDRDEFDCPVLVARSLAGRYVIDGNGAGRARWSVQYPDGDYGVTTTQREALAWADVDYRERTARPTYVLADGDNLIAWHGYSGVAWTRQPAKAKRFTKAAALTAAAQMREEFGLDLAAVPA